MSIKNCLYVGVDVSLKSLTTCILDISGETIFKPKNFDITLAEMNEIEREERRKKDGSVSAINLFAKWYEGEEN